jgi:hypothetical protein
MIQGSDNQSTRPKKPDQGIKACTHSCPVYLSAVSLSEVLINLCFSYSPIFLNSFMSLQLWNPWQWDVMEKCQNTTVDSQSSSKTQKCWILVVFKTQTSPTLTAQWHSKERGKSSPVGLKAKEERKVSASSGSAESSTSPTYIVYDRSMIQAPSWCWRKGLLHFPT